jgi:hypothetical protein
MYFVITTTATANITVNWRHTGLDHPIRIVLYSGTPFGVGPSGGPITTTPPGGASKLADTGAVNSSNLTLGPTSQPVGTYTVYFWEQTDQNNNSGQTTLATIDYTGVGPCP